MNETKEQSFSAVKNLMERFKMFLSRAGKRKFWSTNQNQSCCKCFS